MLEAALMQKEYGGHDTEVHVLIHIGVFQQITGGAATEEESWLQVNAIATEFVG